MGKGRLEAFTDRVMAINLKTARALGLDGDGWTLWDTRPSPFFMARDCGCVLTCW
jgi:hypothetical protein